MGDQRGHGPAQAVARDPDRQPAVQGGQQDADRRINGVGCMGKTEMDQAGEEAVADQGRLGVGQGVADRLGAAKGDDRHVLLRGDESMECLALKGADRIAQGKHLRPIARPTVGCQAAMGQVVPGPQTKTDRSGVTVDDVHGDCSFDDGSFRECDRFILAAD